MYKHRRIFSSDSAVPIASPDRSGHSSRWLNTISGGGEGSYRQGTDVDIFKLPGTEKIDSTASNVELTSLR